MNLFELNSAVIKRQANGKTIWQPRIDCWIRDRDFRGEALPGSFAGCDLNGIYETIGCSNRLYCFNACFSRKYDDTITTHHNVLGKRLFEDIIETPVGIVRQVTRGNSSNGGTMPVKWYVETAADLRVFCYIEAHTNYAFHQEMYDLLMLTNGHLGLPAAYMPRVNIQKLLIELCGVENTYYLLYDEPQAVEDYFRVYSKAQEGYLRAAAASPLEWINYGDNLHCKILPPELLKKYVLPEYEKRAGILRAAGKFVYAHFDGDFRDYLPLMHHCFLDGFEALTPLPQGDVTVEEMKAALGNDLFLVDGIAALLFSPFYPEAQLIAQTKQVLELFEGQLVLGISDELPSDGLLERVALVNEMVNEFNAKR